jgi:ParB/RepB/Spo0J family partition protein
MRSIVSSKNAEGRRSEPLWNVVGYRKIPLSRIRLPAKQLRTDPKITGAFVEQARPGIIEPLIVRRLGNKKKMNNGEMDYELISGGGLRRFLAANENGFGKVNCAIVDVRDEDVWRIALLENSAKEDLPPMDLANLIDQTVRRYAIPQKEIAKLLGREKSTMSNLLRVFRNLILRREVMEGNHSLQAAIELEAIAPKAGGPERRRKEEMKSFMSFVNKTRGMTVSQIRTKIISEFMGQKRKRACRRCRKKLDLDKLGSFMLCNSCQRAAGIEKKKQEERDRPDV